MRVIQIGLVSAACLLALVVMSALHQHKEIQKAQRQTIEKLQFELKQARIIKLDKMCNNRHVLNKICVGQ